MVNKDAYLGPTVAHWARVMASALCVCKTAGIYLAGKVSCRWFCRWN